MSKSVVEFVLDGKIKTISFGNGLNPTLTVLNYLRSLRNHKGVKEGCAEGDCGACTVVTGELSGNKLIYKSIDSCITFLPQIHGKLLLTVENLKVNGKLHPVQKAMIDYYGSQCGYCTPGMVMSMFALYKNHNLPSKEIITDYLTGNLCRCTGYVPILEAAKSVCINNGIDELTANETQIIELLKRINSGDNSLFLESEGYKYFRPAEITETLEHRKNNPDAIIISGGTDAALKQTKKNEILNCIIDISAIEELKYFDEDDNNYYIGAGLTIEELKHLSYGTIPVLNNIIKVFGSKQIRNSATIGGNVGSASPIGDTIPVLFALEASVKVKNLNEEKIIRIEEFITGYRKTKLSKEEIITEIIIPRITSSTKIKSYKISKRRDLDISTVSAAFRIETNGRGTIQKAILAYGGVALTPKRAVKTEKFLTGMEFSEKNVEKAMELIRNEFTPIDDARSGAEFRRVAVANLFMKFYVEES